MLESPSLIRPRFAAILGASLSLGAIGSAQDPAGVDEGTAVEMEVPLGVQCGLGQGFHAGRRAALSERLEQGVIVMKGLDGPRSLARFNQDKLFWYLTGVSAPGAWLVQPIGGEPILFLPRPDRGKESWNGELWDTEDPWAEYVTGIQDIREVSELESSLRELREDHDRFWTSLHPAVALTDSYDTAGPFDQARVNAPWDGVMPREYRIKKWLEDTFEVAVGDLAKDVTLLRWQKTPEELAAMERAAAATVAAFKAAISSTRPGLWERDIEAVMDLEFTRHGAAGPGYGAIVGSGPNSLVLHYMGSHRRMVAGDVLLVDYGPEVDHYVIDVTRTWPVDGTFTARQAELYDAVLTAQKAAIAECKPGNTVMAINRTAIRVLQDKGFGRFVRHGVCHLIGMEVHDPGNLLRPLKPGVCFTVEPGLYERSTGIGIRIEDVVVITEDGCRVLTDGIPKERTAVEALYRENGPLDLLRPSTGR